jgi:3-hydroxymyristoyl/3-hydroxydecanoyl-(acyl carrier protein) dehydratase
LATTELRFPADHLAAQGHFPGNPIIPGAVLLSETLTAIEAGLGVRLSPCLVKSAKFAHPVRPGDCVAIEYSGFVKRGIKFICAVEGEAVLSGEVVCDPVSTVR